VLTMQENDGVVACAKEVLGRGRSTSAGGEIVEEADAVEGRTVSAILVSR
jgi:hypothetical protein